VNAERPKQESPAVARKRAAASL